jgi:hypothetical protein
MSLGIEERRQQALRFLETVFNGACDEGLHFCVFTIGSKERSSKFFKKVDDRVVDYCMDQDAQNRNVYVGQNVFKTPPKYGRGGVEKTDGIFAYVGDIDVGKEGSPETIDAALDIARIGPYRPSFYVKSGSGIHAYWLFSEPWIFQGDKDKGDAIANFRRFIETLAAVAESKDYKVDPTKDLSRIWRVPGTRNFKPRLENKEPTFVTLCAEDRIPRYDHTDFDPYLVALEARPSQLPGQWHASVGLLELDPEAKLPQELLKAAMENDDRFHDTWLMKRHKEFGDDVSRYCFAIANFLIDAGMNDQQVADAITHFRRDIAMKPKIDRKGRLRLDWYQITISKCKADAGARKGVEAITSQVNLSRLQVDPQTGILEVDPHARERIILDLKNVLLVDIERFVQVGYHNAQYYLVTSCGKKLHIGGNHELESFKLFRRVLRVHFRVIVNASAGKVWDDILQHLMAIVEVDLTVNPTAKDELFSTFRSFFNDVRLVSGENASGRAANNQLPFRQDGRVHVNFEKFSQWMRENRLKLFVNANEGYTLFKLSGGLRDRFWAENARNGRGTRPWYWSFSEDDVEGGEKDGAPESDQAVEEPLNGNMVDTGEPKSFNP